MTAAEAYDKIAELAREHALVSEASGGVIVIIHPDVQREEGVFCRIQWVHKLGQHPDRDGVCRCKAEGKGACKVSA